MDTNGLSAVGKPGTHFHWPLPVTNKMWMEVERRKLKVPTCCLMVSPPGDAQTWPACLRGAEGEDHALPPCRPRAGLLFSVPLA